MDYIHLKMDDIQIIEQICRTNFKFILQLDIIWKTFMDDGIHFFGLEVCISIY
jgi:hypothetical protein